MGRMTRSGWSFGIRCSSGTTQRPGRARRGAGPSVHRLRQAAKAREVRPARRPAVTTCEGRADPYADRPDPLGSRIIRVASSLCLSFEANAGAAPRGSEAHVLSRTFPNGSEQLQRLRTTTYVEVIRASGTGRHPTRVQAPPVHGREGPLHPLFHVRPGWPPAGREGHWIGPCAARSR